MKIKEALGAGKLKLVFKSLSPHLDAEVLLGHILNKPKEFLYSEPEVELTPEQADAFYALIAERQHGKPVAYITGEKEFFGCALRVTPDVMIPRPETEALVNEAAQIINKHKFKTAYEIGTGSGAIAIALASTVPSIQIIASDISNPALEIAAQNIARHKLDGRIKLTHSHLADHIKSADIVVANLPYLPRGLKLAKDLSFEPTVALFADDGGLALYKQLLDRRDIRFILIEISKLGYIELERYIKKLPGETKTSPIRGIDGQIVGMQIENVGD